MRNFQMNEKRFRRLQERYSDPLLTALTIMLAMLLFVVGPLQAAGVVAVHYFAFAFAAVLLAAVFIVSGSALAVGAILVAVALILAATVSRLRQPSVLDIYLDAAGWLITGLTLTIVVARAVFAPGKVTFHRIIGAVLLYLNIGLIFVALFCFVALLARNVFTGLAPLQDDLAVDGYGDIVPLHPFARGLANVEAIIGQLYPATLLARLVTLEIESRRRS
jgi:hypothetical protein